MGNIKTEKTKRTRQRKRLREQLLTEQEVMKQVPIPGTRFISGIERCLEQKRVSEHLSDDNFNGEW
jgi:hypothetical protein